RSGGCSRRLRGRSVLVAARLAGRTRLLRDVARAIGISFAELIVSAVGGYRVAGSGQLAVAGFFVELQAVAHARVDKHLDGGKRNDKSLGNAIERQLHLEAIVRDDRSQKRC